MAKVHTLYIDDLCRLAAENEDISLTSRVILTARSGSNPATTKVGNPATRKVGHVCPACNRPRYDYYNWLSHTRCDEPLIQQILDNKFVGPPFVLRMISLYANSKPRFPNGSEILIGHRGYKNPRRYFWDTKTHTIVEEQPEQPINTARKSKGTRKGKGTRKSKSKSKSESESESKSKSKSESESESKSESEIESSGSSKK